MSRSQAPNPAGSRKISFNVSEQYDIQDVVGEGAYGVVWYAIFHIAFPFALRTLDLSRLTYHP